MPVLIYTQAEDPHVKGVSDSIYDLGEKPILFERYRRDHFITHKYRRLKYQLLINVAGKTYDLNKDIHAIWWRPKPYILAEIPGGNGDLTEHFCKNEWYYSVYALKDVAPEIKWVNPLDTNYKLSFKPYQLKLALDCGLLIPETVITNYRKDILDLAKSGEIIYKTVSSFFSLGKCIFTNKLNPSYLSDEYEDSISMAPGIYQALIEKNHELRVTIVGDQVFTVKINSQNHKNAKIDWRKGFNDEMWEVGELSKETQVKLLNFHRRANLIYAAYDFAVDKTGKEIFFECNPAGQWFLVDDKNEKGCFPICKKMAEILVK